MVPREEQRRVFAPVPEGVTKVHTYPASLGPGHRVFHLVYVCVLGDSLHEHCREQHHHQ
jgi:hypothetical protein